jgi:hypothetical protein
MEEDIYRVTLQMPPGGYGSTRSEKVEVDLLLAPKEGQRLEWEGEMFRITEIIHLPREAQEKGQQRDYSLKAPSALLVLEDDQQ